MKGVRKPSSITGGVHGGYHLAVDDLMISLHNKAVLKRQVNEYRVFYPLLNYPSYTRSYDHRYPRTGKVYSLFASHFNGITSQVLNAAQLGIPNPIGP